MAPYVRTTGLLLAVMVTVTLCCAALADQTPVKLPAELAKRIAAAQEDIRNDRPTQAIARLKAYEGADSPLRHLLLGHAHARIDQLPAATEAYTRALAMDPSLAQAGQALASVYARQEKWREAGDLLGKHTVTDTCGADTLYLYAQVAQRLADQRLVRLMVDKAITRFPGQVRFRRMDLDLLIAENRHAQAGRVAMELLARSPVDLLLWQQVAFARSRDESETDRLAALEAMLLCRPDNIGHHRQFLAAHLATGDWLTVVDHGRRLLGGPLAKSAVADAAAMELLVMAADMGARDGVLATWIELIPVDRRARPVRLASARLALRQGKTAAARESLGVLIAAGESDPSVFLWAAHLAERSGDFPTAETLYTQAGRLSGSSARLASLYLARLHLRRDTPVLAARLLRSHLAASPEDASARALLALAEAAVLKAQAASRLPD